MKSYNLKENHVGSAVSKFWYTKTDIHTGILTDKHNVTFILGLQNEYNTFCLNHDQRTKYLCTGTETPTPPLQNLVSRG